jgi:hypothetical protein
MLLITAVPKRISQLEDNVGSHLFHQSTFSVSDFSPADSYSLQVSLASMKVYQHEWLCAVDFKILIVRSPRNVSSIQKPTLHS